MTPIARNLSRSVPSSVVLALAVFGLIWVCWLGIQSARSEFTITHGPAFPHHEDIALLLVVAAIGLVINRRWSVALSVLFCAIAFSVVFLRDFSRVASLAEVPFFSRAHFHFWWINFETWKIFLSLVSATALCLGMTRLLHRARS